MYKLLSAIHLLHVKNACNQVFRVEPDQVPTLCSFKTSKNYIAR
jgi:hypothetical protein